LRELAKASVLAKYLVDSCMRVPDAWLAAAGAKAEIFSHRESLEIPQLWNERAYGKIRLEDGTIVEEGVSSGLRHSVYGGVQFGLDRFKVASHGRASMVMFQSVSLGVSRVGQPRAMVEGFPGLSRVGQPRAIVQGFPGASRALLPTISGADPRGVDLNLDNFDLSKAKRVKSHVTALQVGQDACDALGPNFWLNVDKQQRVCL